MASVTKFFFAVTLGLGLSLALIWLMDGLTVVRAATFTVTKFTDSNDGICDADCSLREAIRAANATNNPDTITLMAGIYVLTIAGVFEDAAATRDLDITNPLTLTGAGTELTVIDGTGVDRLLHILNGTTVISGVTLRNGSAGEPFIGYNWDGNGGGILNAATLTLINTNVSSNTTINYGSGIYNTGNVTLTNSTVNSARGGIGNGIYNSNGNVTLINSTVISNKNGVNGIYNSNGNVMLINSAVSNNTGSGIRNFDGTVMLIRLIRNLSEKGQR